MQATRGLNRQMKSEQLTNRPGASSEPGARLDDVHSFKIKGYYINRDSFVDVVVEGPHQTGIVTLKIDTAAQRTVISPKDAHSLGLDDLVRSPDGSAATGNSPNGGNQNGSTSLRGFSGKESAVGVPAKCTIWFWSEVPDGDYDVMLGLEAELLIVESDEEWPDSAQSLLGNDLLEYLELTLCQTKNKVVLESDGITNKIFGYAIPRLTSDIGNHS